MNIIKGQWVKLFETSFAVLVLSVPAFCQSGPPAPPPDPTLDAYYFPDTNWPSEFGFLPIASSNLVSVPLWNRNALLLDTTNVTPAYLNYNIVEDNGWTNIVFDTGALRCVFINSWASGDTNQNGEGPMDQSYLLAAGDFTSGSPDGLWAVYIDAGGNNIYFGGISNSVSTVFVSAPISWASNSIHFLGISYTSTNSTMYLDGQWAATGGPVTIVPATNVWTNGFFIGSDAAGYEQAQGLFLHVDFYNSNFFDPDWSDIFNDSYFTNGWLNLSNNFTTWLAAQGGGFHFDSSDSEGWPLPPNPTTTVNTDYGDYTNFWLTVSNSPTQAYINVVNTLSNVTYEVLTNRSPASTNWGIWQTFLASNSISRMPPISLSSNALFFRGAMVWSTCTNSSTLPDWMSMLYFNSLCAIWPVDNGDIERGCSIDGLALLGYWSFNDSGSNTWLGNYGQQPLTSYGLQNPASPWTNALQIDTNTVANLSYRYMESNGTININCINGAASFWFKPDWNGGVGSGTGTNGQLLVLGDGTNSLWSLYVDTTGSNLLFQTGSNGVFITYFTNVITNFYSNTWYAITLDYSTSSTELYLNGLLAQTGPGITNYPDIPDRMAYGLSIGSDHTGQSQMHGSIDELYTYDCPLSADQILSDYIEDLLTADESGGSGIGLPDWNTYNSINGLVNGSSLQVFTPLK